MSKIKQLKVVGWNIARLFSGKDLAATIKQGQLLITNKGEVVTIFHEWTYLDIIQRSE